MAEQVATVGLSEKVQNCVRTRSLIAAIILLIPMWGIEVILYVIVLWGMYAELCKLARVPFKLKSIISGFVTNIIIVLIVNLVLDFIPIVGWISVAVYGYSTTLFSGCAYLEVLAAMHQKGRVKERFDAGNVVSIFNNKRIE